MPTRIVIDNLEFARRGEALAGEVAVADLARLRDALFSERGVLNYTLTGKLDAKGDPLLVCGIDGVLALRCQRCLEALEYPLHVVSTLRVVAGMSQFDGAGDEDEPFDAIPAGAAMDVLAQIEEEILLSLPISPLHEPGACREPGTVRPAGDERVSPFGVLMALKEKH